MIAALSANLRIRKEFVLPEIDFSFQDGLIFNGTGFERQSSGDIERKSDDTFYFERKEAMPNLVERVLSDTAPGGIGRKAVEEEYKGVVNPNNIKFYPMVPFVAQRVVAYLNNNLLLCQTTVEIISLEQLAGYAGHITY